MQFRSASAFTYGITRSHFYKKRMRIIELVIHDTESPGALEGVEILLELPLKPALLAAC